MKYLQFTWEYAARNLSLLKDGPSFQLITKRLQDSCQFEYWMHKDMHICLINIYFTIIPWLIMYSGTHLRGHPWDLEKVSS